MARLAAVITALPGPYGAVAIGSAELGQHRFERGSNHLGG